MNTTIDVIYQQINNNIQNNINQIWEEIPKDETLAALIKIHYENKYTTYQYMSNAEAQKKFYEETFDIVKKHATSPKLKKLILKLEVLNALTKPVVLP